MIPEAFRHIENFEHLRKGDRILVGYNPDGRKANFCFNGRIDQHHRTQRNYKFLKGYFRFEDGKYFDKNKRVLTDRYLYSRETPAYIFSWSPERELLWRRCQKQKFIREWSKNADAGDRKVLLQLIAESGVPVIGTRIQTDQEAVMAIAVAVELIGLPQLEDIVHMLTAGTATDALPRARRMAMPKREVFVDGPARSSVTIYDIIEAATRKQV